MNDYNRFEWSGHLTVCLISPKAKPLIRFTKLIQQSAMSDVYLAGILCVTDVMQDGNKPQWNVCVCVAFNGGCKTKSTKTIIIVFDLSLSHSVTLTLSELAAHFAYGMAYRSSAINGPYTCCIHCYCYYIRIHFDLIPVYPIALENE